MTKVTPPGSGAGAGTSNSRESSAKGVGGFSSRTDPALTYADQFRAGSRHAELPFFSGYGLGSDLEAKAVVSSFQDVPAVSKVVKERGSHDLPY